MLAERHVVVRDVLFYVCIYKKKMGCYIKGVVVFCDINNLCNLGIKGNHCNTLASFLFDLQDDPSS